MASDSAYVWGSNGGVLNAAVVLGFAYDLTRDPKYAGGVVDCLDYILGRNPLGFSYVAGYGRDAMRNPHHRVWAHLKDPRCPRRCPAPSPVGPNPGAPGPVHSQNGMGGCPP